jgi:hypothetical protein
MRRCWSGGIPVSSKNAKLAANQLKKLKTNALQRHTQKNKFQGLAHVEPRNMKVKETKQETETLVTPNVACFP